MNIPVREGETIEGSRTTRNRPYPVLKSQVLNNENISSFGSFAFTQKHNPGPKTHKLRQSRKG